MFTYVNIQSRSGTGDARTQGQSTESASIQTAGENKLCILKMEVAVGLGSGLLDV